jgi:transposase
VDAAAEDRDDATLNGKIQAAEDERKEAAREIASKKGKGRLSLRGAERQVHATELSEDERRCEQCGQPRQKIGEEIARRIEYVPGHFVQHEYRLSKYACADCRDGVLTAPGPPRVLERSIADASVLAHVVVSKYVDHTPLHRLHESYARTGASIPVSTLSDWTGGVADLVEPLVDRLGEKVLAAHVVRTDATGLKVLDPRSPANIQRGTMWVYLGDEHDVVFRYAETGDGASGPWEFLSGREGPIQADGASVFDRLFNGQVARAVEVGCLAHARRKLVALQDTDCRVAYPIRLIRRVYRLEYLADLKDYTPPERAALRQERTLPIFEKLKRWAVVTHATEPPSSDLAKAAAYMLNQWEALTRFLYDGQLSPDNNLTEQQLRAIALGRKNYTYGPPRQLPTLPAPGDHHKPTAGAASRPASNAPRWRASFRSDRSSCAMAAPSAKPGARRRDRRERRRHAGRSAERVTGPWPRARATARRPSGRDACLAVVPSRHAACPRGQARRAVGLQAGRRWRTACHGIEPQKLSYWKRSRGLGAPVV